MNDIKVHWKPVTSMASDAILIDAIRPFAGVLRYRLFYSPLVQQRYLQIDPCVWVKTWRVV